MNKLYERIKDKRIIIFGTGILQADISGMFHFKEMPYYIEDHSTKRERSDFAFDKPVYGSDYLINEDRENLFILICDDDEEYAANKLESMGFKEGIHYAFGEELLVDLALFETIRSKRIHIWGAGNTYTYHKEDLQEYVSNIESIIVSNAGGNPLSLDGIPVKQFSPAEERQENTFIIVCSIYYDEISSLLKESGYHIGRDFIHIRTFVTLAKLSTYSSGEHTFIDRKKNSDELLVILAGYKKFVWESVFPRLKRSVPEHMDVVLVTSGLVNEELQELCENYGWSYISTVRNNVSLAINIAITRFPQAKYIYKIDEDIFTTAGCFEAMRETYDRLTHDSKYEVGFVTPLIPVNGYGYVRLLELFDAVGLWEERFGELMYTDCYRHHRTIHDSPEAAMFMWGEENPQFADIDAMAEKLANRSFQYSICPIRYSIGFILFTRRNWMKMGMFPVKQHMNLGADEEHICKFCMMHARVMAVAENTIVGHLSYGPQHKKMEEYYRAHPEKFFPKVED
ncbi:MAG TPA: hypothetical protein PKG75_11400 [Clostridiales bacterium]|nr:hypothetical protein [Clostridiales bacterium]